MKMGEYYDTMKYEVATVDSWFRPQPYIEVLGVFDTYDEAINYIIPLYIEDILNDECNRWLCKYKWRKIYQDLYSDYNDVVLCDVREYVNSKDIKNQPINHYLDTIG
jgi:hypothetical protein